MNHIHADAFIIDRYTGSHFFCHGQQRLHLPGGSVFQENASSGRQSRRKICSCHDPVRRHFVLGFMQFFHAFDPKAVLADSFDIRPGCR